MDVVKECGLRADGRLPAQLRETRCAAAGERVRLEHGNTVVSSVLAWDAYRPRRKKGLQVSVAFLDSAYQEVKRREKKREEYEKYLELTFCPLLAGLDAGSFEVAHSVKQDDGSLLAVLINATSLLLARSGVPMLSLALAVTCAQVQAEHGRGYVLDLSAAEEAHRLPAVTMAFACRSMDVSFVLCENRPSVRAYAGLAAAARAGFAETRDRLCALLR